MSYDDDDDFSGLRWRLADLADDPAPANPFDAVRTAATGRRRVLVRRTSAVGGTGTLAVALVFGVMAAFAPAAPPPAVSAAAGSGIVADPLVKNLDFGWLPPSLPNVSYLATAYGSGNDVVAQGNKTPDGAPRIDLQSLPDNSPGTVNGNERMIPVALNDGRQAYWVTQSAGGGLVGDFQLRFPTKDHRWVSMDWSVNWGQYGSTTINGVPESMSIAHAKIPPTSVPASAQWQQDLLRVATEVTDSPTRIPMPLRLTGLPASFTPLEAVLWRPGLLGAGAPGTWSAMITFYPRNEASTTIEVGPPGTLALQVPPIAKDTKCMTSAGLDACVQGDSPALDKLGGAKGLLSMVTLLGPDEKRWTTDVIVP